jgi:acyl transferase domain-containing protein
VRLHEHTRAPAGAGPGHGGPGDVAPAATARSLALSRARMEHRAVVLAEDTESLVSGLEALASGAPDPHVVRGRSAGGGVTAFVYSGQGSQRLGMGRELHRHHPVFAKALDEVADGFDRHLDTPLRSVIWAQEGSPEAALLDQTLYTQAGVFAFEVALTRLLESLGLTPDYVVGHSIGELAAAYVAGVFSLEDAVALVAARGRMMQDLPEGGVMVAVQAGEQEVRTALGRAKGTVSVAAVNSPEGVVLSGEESAVLAVVEEFIAGGRRVRRLAVTRAFHSALMDPVLEPFARVAAGVRYHRPRVPLVSNLTGGRAGDEVRTGDYWVRHVREAVRFADGIAHLRAEGVSEFVEVGPDGVLSSMVQSCLSGDRDAEVTALSGGARPETRELAEGLAALDTRGTDVDWAALLPETVGTVPLPTYPFQRRRFWMNPPVAGRIVIETGTGAPEGAQAAPAGNGAVATTGGPGTAGTVSPVARADLAGMDSQERAETLLEAVRRETAALLGHPSPRDVSADQGFLDMGLDSLGAVRLGVRLSALTGLEVSAAKVFDHPAPRVLADHLADELDPGLARESDPEAEEERVRAVLARVPVAGLRAAGLLEALLALDPGGGPGDSGAAGPASDRAETEPDAGQVVDDMDVDDLVRMVYGQD